MPVFFSLTRSHARTWRSTSAMSSSCSGGQWGTVSSPRCADHTALTSSGAGVTWQGTSAARSGPCPGERNDHRNLNEERRMAMIAVTINGRRQNVDLPDDTPLLWALRDQLGLTGTKFGCGMALCGACTVHVDGQPVRSCITPIAAVAGKQIVTIEAVGVDKVGQSLQAAWVDLGVPQCGYCQAGQIMAAAALLKRNPKPTDQDIDDAMSNVCRCGTYQRIRAAVHQAAANTNAAIGNGKKA